MKKLTRLLLINWHYFQNQLIDFDTINFLTGNTGAGKSTIVDALQVALLGETKTAAFNSAAQKKSHRTLKSYLVGSLGEDINDGTRSLRDGKDFSSYVVAEFWDDVRGIYFCVGAVFDVYAKGGDVSQRFFWVRCRIPEHRFIVDGKAMKSYELTKWLKEKYPNLSETRDNPKSYQDLLKSRFNVHEERFFSMMKKAISFQPISNLEKFITENVCDMEDTIDILTMQENIHHYRYQEQLVQEFEKKKASLSKICKQYQEVEKLRTQETIQRFFIDYYDWQSFSEQLKKAHLKLEQLEKEIAEQEEQYQKLSQQNEIFQKQYEELNQEIIAYRIENNLEGLQRERKDLSERIDEIQRKIKVFVNAIRTLALRWQNWFENCIPLLKTDSQQKIAQHFEKCLKQLLQCKEENLSSFSVAWFSNVREQYLATREMIRPILEESQRISQDQQQWMASLHEEIHKLKNGLKPYDKKAEFLKKAVSDGLRQKYHKEIPVSFLADMIEVTDETWHNAVEAYLNTQRMNLIVSPEYFMDAYEIYKSIPLKEKIHGFAIVDLERVHHAQSKVMQGSLAEIVKSQDSYVQSYIDYLLGKVMRCEHDAELRNYPVSVTKDCMLYKSFAVRAMNQDAYLKPYIGRNAVQVQIVLKTKQLETAKTLSADAERKISVLKPIIENEWFLTENYISSTVAEIFQYLEIVPDLEQQLQKVSDKLRKIGLCWIQDREKELSDIKQQIKVIDEKIRKTYTSKELLEQEKNNLTAREIPSLKEKQEIKWKYVLEQYSEAFIQTTGIPQYQQELSHYNTTNDILKKLESSLRQIRLSLSKASEKLIDLRGEYNKIQRTSFNLTDISTNQEFEEELQKISDNDLPKYRKQIEEAKENAMEQFKNEFLYKLRCNIENAHNKITELNQALKRIKFGDDSYHFRVEPNPTYREYYDMIMSKELEFGNTGLFSTIFTERFQSTIDNLFAQILSLSENDTSKTAQNVTMFSQYKTYLTFKLYSTNSSGRTEDLSKSIFTKSGGESQTPFYIAILASFAQLYRTTDIADYGNTVRIVIFDEAFSKMDDARIIESIHLLRDLDLQAIICTPPDKASDLQPISDKTLLVHKERQGKVYHSTVAEFSKQLEEVT